MKIMSFNVRIDVPVDGNNGWSFRKQAICEYVNRVHPDFVGFQEPSVEMVDYLKSSLPDYQMIGLPRDSRGESTPLFYRKDQYHLIFGKTIWLSDTTEVPSKFSESAFPRIATYGVFENSEGAKFLICNTHLDYVSDQIQAQQMTVLLNTLHAHEWPQVIMGDFNATSNQTVHRMLRENHYKHTYSLEQLKQASFHAFLGTQIGNPIDYIYLSHEWTHLETVIDQKTVHPMMLSDHYPVIAMIESMQ